MIYNTDKNNKESLIDYSSIVKKSRTISTRSRTIFNSVPFGASIVPKHDMKNRTGHEDVNINIWRKTIQRIHYKCINYKIHTYD